MRQLWGNRSNPTDGPADSTDGADPAVPRAGADTAGTAGTSLNAADPNPTSRPRSPDSTAFRAGLWGGLGLLSALAVALAVREVRSVIVLVVMSAFLAIGLTTPVNFLTARRWRRHWAVVAVAAGVVIVLALIIVVLVSVLRSQVAALIDDLPTLLHRLLAHKTIRDLDKRYHLLSSLQTKVQDPDVSSTVLSSAFGIGLGTVRALANIFVVFVLTMYFLGALPQLGRSLTSLAPASRRGRVSQLGNEIVHRTGRYVIGALAVGLVAGTVTAVFLLVVGLGRFAFPLALLVALLDLVPLVGAIAGAGTVILVCFATSLPLGVGAAAFYLVYEILEGYVIYPRVMRSSIDVPEYVTIIAVLVGGHVGWHRGCATEPADRGGRDLPRAGTLRASPGRA